MEKPKNAWLLLELLEKWLPYKLRKFQMAFNFFLFLTLSNLFSSGTTGKLDF